LDKEELDLNKNPKVDDIFDRWQTL